MFTLRSNMENMNTPRTDAVDNMNEDFDVVGAHMTALACQLERELTEKTNEVERLREELELYKAANSDVRRIAEERNKAISLAKAAIKLASIGEGQWDYNDDTLELTRIESELEALNPTNK